MIATNRADSLGYFARLPHVKARSKHAKKTAALADELVEQLIKLKFVVDISDVGNSVSKGPAVAPAHGTLQKGPAVWF